MNMKGDTRAFDSKQSLQAGKERIAVEAVNQIPLGKITTNQFQPRSVFNQGELEQLASTIKEKGILQPIVLRKVDDPSAECPFEIIAGERRWRAARLAGLTMVPAIIRTADDQKSREDALIENVQRVDLVFWDTMNAYAGLMDFRGGAKEVAAVVGKDIRTIEMYLKRHREINSIPEVSQFYNAKMKESEKREASLNFIAAYEFAGYVTDSRRLSKSNQNKYNDMLKQLKKRGTEEYQPKPKRWFDKKNGRSVSNAEEKMFEETDKEPRLRICVRKTGRRDDVEKFQEIENSIGAFKERLASLTAGQEGGL
jgi:ParB family chromosome partitioning protein